MVSSDAVAPACEALTVRHALRRAGRHAAHIDARLLLQYVLQLSHAGLVTHPERTLTPAQHARFDGLLDRRGKGEPIAYLVGEREFFGLNFGVTPEVLIPRPETELLVELALERLPAERACRVLDLGTGNGAIAIALVAHRPLAEVVAVDVSEAALCLATENARRLLAPNPLHIFPHRRTGSGCWSRIRFLKSDWFSQLGGENFDLIVANPPYVAAGDPHLEQGDVRFEPRTALVGGEDGLACIRHIVADARRHLKPGGWLLFEHGFDQAGSCRRLLQRAGYADIFCRRDLAGIPRVAGGRSCV